MSALVSNLMAQESDLLPLRSQEDADRPHSREKQVEPGCSPRVSFSPLGRQRAVRNTQGKMLTAESQI